MSVRSVWLLIFMAAVVTGCGSGSGSGDVPEGYDIDELIANADLERGEKLFLQCRACHTLGQGQGHKAGPNLYRVIGRQAGTAPGFDYSDALKNSGIVWSAETLDAWLKQPRDLVPGNRMIFMGIGKARDRANLIAYLRRETAAAQ